MKGFTQEHAIPATPAAVFAVLADLDQAREWMPDIQAIRKLGDGPIGLGSKWIETRIVKGRRKPFVSTIEVTEFAPGEAFAIRVEQRAARMTFRFGLVQEGKATRVHYEAKMRMKGLLAPFTGKMVRMVQESDVDLLARLEEQVRKAKPQPARKAAAKKAGRNPKK